MAELNAKFGELDFTKSNDRDIALLIRGLQASLAGNKDPKINLDTKTRGNAKAVLGQLESSEKLSKQEGKKLSGEFDTLEPPEQRRVLGTLVETLDRQEEAFINKPNKTPEEQKVLPFVQSSLDDGKKIAASAAGRSNSISKSAATSSPGSNLVESSSSSPSSVAPKPRVIPQNEDPAIERYADGTPLPPELRSRKSTNPQPNSSIEPPRAGNQSIQGGGTESNVTIEAGGAKIIIPKDIVIPKDIGNALKGLFNSSQNDPNKNPTQDNPPKISPDALAQAKAIAASGKLDLRDNPKATPGNAGTLTINNNPSRSQSPTLLS